MSRQRIKKSIDLKYYCRWLITDYVFFDYYNIYSDLFFRLLTTEFEILIDLDENRLNDGMRIRNTFFEEYMDADILDEVYNLPCSVLEVLIALSWRLDHEYIGDHMTIDTFEERKEYELFFEMVENLGLDQFPNKYYDEREIDRILKKWLLRKFKKNGEGSIFPISYPVNNQKEIEIWAQAMEYINEKY